MQSLPENFDGVFRFTNFTDTDFVVAWNSVEYTFPAMKTIPMVIPDSTMQEIQSIRKMFARKLAVREFYKTPKFISMNGQQVPAMYTDADLEPFIQKCLEPLPVANATMKAMPKDSEENYSVTEPIDDSIKDVNDLVAKKGNKK